MILYPYLYRSCIPGRSYNKKINMLQLCGAHILLAFILLFELDVQRSTVQIRFLSTWGDFQLPI